MLKQHPIQSLHMPITLTAELADDISLRHTVLNSSSRSLTLSYSSSRSLTLTLSEHVHLIHLTHANTTMSIGRASGKIVTSLNQRRRSNWKQWRFVFVSLTGSYVAGTPCFCHDVAMLYADATNILRSWEEQTLLGSRPCSNNIQSNHFICRILRHTNS